MNTLPNIDMIEATRLTREGRLVEAMAILRGVRLGAPSSAASSRTTAAEPGGDTRSSLPGNIPRILDLLPPSIVTGDSWRSPHSHETHTAVPPDGVNQRQIPEAYEGFPDRIGQLRSPRGLDGRVRPAAVDAPAPLLVGAQFEDCTYSNEAGSRGYKLYIPSGYRGQTLSLVVMLHGCTQSPDDFAAGTQMNDLAEEQTFLVVYPAQARTANVSRCWNWFSASDQVRDRGEPSLIAGITREVMSNYGIDRRRVYVAGLSAGGAAAAIMAATYPDLYAAIGVHSGLACGAASDLPSAFAAMRHGGALAASREFGLSKEHKPIEITPRLVPTIVFHGDQDKTVHPHNGFEVLTQFGAGTAELKATVEFDRMPNGHSYSRSRLYDKSGHVVFENWLVHGAGHAWSGGSAAGSYTDPRGPNATREMFRFFREQVQPVSARPD